MSVIENFTKIIEEAVFSNLEAKLLKAIAKNPERFVGRYRLTNPQTKIVQYVLQSQEIKFGNALEKIFKNYFENVFKGQYMERKSEGGNLDFDQLFMYNGKIVLIEQKIRDDHDSTKKIAQVENYNKKLQYLKNKYTQEIYSCMWFIDDGFSKNKNFYLKEIGQNHLFYGEQLISFLDSVSSSCQHIIFWKELHTFLDDFSFYLDVEKIVNFNNENIDLSGITSGEFCSLLENEKIVSEIFPVLGDRKVILDKIKLTLEKKRNDTKKKRALELIEKLEGK